MCPHLLGRELLPPFQQLETAGERLEALGDGKRNLPETYSLRPPAGVFESV
jgi:hypothetical protein